MFCHEMEDLGGDKYLLGPNIFIKREEINWSLLVEKGCAKALRQVILGKFKE